MSHGSRRTAHLALLRPVDLIQLFGQIAQTLLDVSRFFDRSLQFAVVRALGNLGVKHRVNYRQVVSGRFTSAVASLFLSSASSRCDVFASP